MGFRQLEDLKVDCLETENAIGLGEEQHGEALLEEFFSGGISGSQNHRSILPELSSRKGRWENFIKRFKTRSEKTEEELERKNRDEKKAISEEPIPSYEGKTIYHDYRKRASDLSGHCAQKYRNTFFTNARYAVFAVILASVSLLLWSQYLAATSGLLICLLIVLAAWKLGLVF